MGKHLHVYPTTRDKMLAVLKRHGQTMSSASREMGRAANFISEQIRTYNGVAEPIKVFLDLKYGMKPEDYKPDKPATAEPAPKAETKVAPLPDMIPEQLKKELYDLIYNATYKAVRNAWEYKDD